MLASVYKMNGSLMEGKAKIGVDISFRFNVSRAFCASGVHKKSDLLSQNNITGAVKTLSPLNRSFGSNNAANAIGGRFQSGINAGTTAEWPEGIQIVSWDTTRKTLLKGISNFLWYKGTEAEAHINNFFREHGVTFVIL